VIEWTFHERHGSRMSPDLFTHIPDRPPGGGLLLDLGCGEHRPYQRLLESTGFTYVGLDTAGRGPQILGDAHRLPFVDSSIDVVVAISLLEHLRAPAVALDEIRRCLRPGGTLIGTVAFLEPYHMRSYLHHSHRGTIQALTDAGLEVLLVAPARDWTGLDGVLEMGWFGGFQRLSRLVTRPIVWPLEIMSRVWWRLGAALGRLPRGTLDRDVMTAGGFAYVARRPAEGA
jgi:SAM-dependent methyltransferase